MSLTQFRRRCAPVSAIVSSLILAAVTSSASAAVISTQTLSLTDIATSVPPTLSFTKAPANSTITSVDITYSISYRESWSLFNTTNSLWNGRQIFSDLVSSSINLTGGSTNSDVLNPFTAGTHTQVQFNMPRRATIAVQSSPVATSGSFSITDSALFSLFAGTGTFDYVANLAMTAPVYDSNIFRLNNPTTCDLVTMSITATINGTVGIVPEPSALALLPLAGTALIRRRR